MRPFIHCAWLQRGSAIVGTALCAVSAFLVLAGVLWFLDDFDHTTPNARDTALHSPSVQHPLPTDPADPLVTADVATVRAFRDALQRELASTNTRLIAEPTAKDDAKRRFVLEMLLTNTGRTGLNDRLAEIDQAIQLQDSALSLLPHNRELTRRAIAGIHIAAESCRSGALKQAAEYLAVPTN